MRDILLYVLLGGTIGGLSGLLGIGGGVLLVPALMVLFDWPYPKAAGTTLAVLVPPIGLLAAWKSYQIVVSAARTIASSWSNGKGLDTK